MIFNLELCDKLTRTVRYKVLELRVFKHLCSVTIILGNTHSAPDFESKSTHKNNPNIENPTNIYHLQINKDT